VLIKDDYSDLEEKLNWCNNNQDKCIQIVKNANFFMGQFKNKIVESYIEDKVLSKYFELVN
jgi:alpha/beta superfamily hydrolase